MIKMTLVRSQDRVFAENPDGGGLFAPLHANEKGGGTVVVRMEAGSRGAPHGHPGGEELVMLAGELELDGKRLGPGDYAWTPPGGRHSAAAITNCEFVLVLPVPPVYETTDDADPGDVL